MGDKEKTVTKQCSVERCENKVHSRGLCIKHYDKWWRYGSPLAGTETLKHGMTKTREHESWLSMKQRCYNIKGPDYKNYGGRGIKVCARWRTSFINFYEDMGPKPEDLTLERIDNNGNYEPDNCKWATYTEQARNRRNNVIYGMEIPNKIRQMNTAGLPSDLISEKLGLSSHIIGSIIEKRSWV